MTVLGFTSDLGFGDDEVAAAPGDSGGATFIDGLVAGVTSWGHGWLSSLDATPGVTDSSWGELNFDTRVSSYADWLEPYLPDENIEAVPEPTSMTLIGLGSIGLLVVRRRRRQQAVDQAA